MDLAVLQAFAKHAAAESDTPADYTAVRAVAQRQFPKLAAISDIGRQVMRHPIGRNVVGGAAVGAGIGAYRGYRDAPPGARMANAANEARGGALLGGIAGGAGSLMKRATIGEYLTHGAEVAGLGVLAYPTIRKVMGRPVSERTSHAAELGGLGMLAVPSAIHLGHGATRLFRR